MLTLQSFKSRIVCLLIFKVNQDSLGDVILLTSQGVSFTEVQEGLNVKRGVSALCLPVSLLVSENVDVGLSAKRPSKELTYSKRELAKKEFGRGIVT